MEYQIDPDLIAGFIAESQESLAPLDSLLLTLTDQPEDHDRIGEIFRPFHSIKGSAAFFGLLQVKELSHRLEDLLDLLRQKKISASTALVDLILSGLDLLRRMFDNVLADKAETDGFPDQYQQMLAELNQTISGKADLSLEMLVGEIHQRLTDLAPELPPAVSEQVTEMLDLLSPVVAPRASSRPSFSAESSDGFQDDPLTRIQFLLSEDIADELEEESAQAVAEALQQLHELTAGTPGAQKLVQEALDHYHSFMQTNIGFDALLAELILQSLGNLESIWQLPSKAKTTAPSATFSPEPAATEISQSREAPGTGQKKGKTMRVAEATIDNFLEYVGELVVVEEMFNYLQKKLTTASALGNVSSDFRRVIETFSVLSANLRRSIMAIRSVPIKGLLQKAPRIVHEAVKNNEKQIQVEIVGDTLLVDKSYLDLLDAPFGHMVRNAADHGVESQAERRKAAKAENGTITIIARETEKEVQLQVADDGRGIDYEAIARKAESLGLIAPGGTPDDETVKKLLFASGVSTAQTVTDVSGRGVGMDVVRENIESAGGYITIESTPGQGSTFAIHLPRSVSTQIIEGFMVRAGTEMFILPMELVAETFGFKFQDVSTVSGKGRLIARRGTLLPLVSLAAAVNGDASDKFDQTEETRGTVIAISSTRQEFALLVDEIVAVQKVVVKDIDGLAEQNRIFQGAGIMGDGSVAMIIGADGLAALSTQ